VRLDGGFKELVLTPVSDIPRASPEVIEASESNYRRGYWDGVLAACNEIIMGATQHDVRLWLFRELKEWAQRGYEAKCCKGEHPPSCKHKRSYEEATIAPPTKSAERSGGRCFVYAIGDGHGNVKIGVATNIKHRMRSLQTGNASRLYLIAYVPVQKHYDAYRIEAKAHSSEDLDKRCGEWFAMADLDAVQVLFEAADECGFEIEPVEIEHRVY
jgi:hypothetical protein